MPTVLGRIANSRPVAKIKTGRVSQPITDADDATGLGMQRAPGVKAYCYAGLAVLPYRTITIAHVMSREILAAVVSHCLSRSL